MNGITVRGLIPRADKEKLTFVIQLFDGRRIESTLPPEHRDTILAAFDSYELGQRVAIHAIGLFNRSEKLLSLESIEHVTLLDPLDVPARLDELRVLVKGWLDGHGLPPSHDGLDWLASDFTSHFSDELELPYTYPTESGGVRFEWETEHADASLDIDLESRKGIWHLINHSDGQEGEEEINLTVPEGWTRLRTLVKPLQRGSK